MTGPDRRDLGRVFNEVPELGRGLGILLTGLTTTLTPQATK
jgi:hypothetical protein